MLSGNAGRSGGFRLQVAAAALVVGHMLGVPGPATPARGEPSVPGEMVAVCAAGQPEGAAASLCYAVGDQLRIAFYERMDEAADEPRAPAKPAVSELVERVELTGSYVIQADGRVHLPLIGAVRIAGLDDTAAQEMLSGAFRAVSRHTAKVSIMIAEREPIYVVGAVSRPGMVKYLPGMTVLHAIALSDGIEGARPEYSRALDALRERERREHAIERLKRQLARRQVLLGERNGARPPAPDERLVALAGKAEAESLVAGFTNERTLLATSRGLQKAVLDQTIVATADDIARLQARITRLGATITARQERLESFGSAQNRGTLNPFSLHQARSELIDIQERQEEIKTALVQLEQKIVQAQNDKRRLGLDADIELDRELKAIASDVAEDELTIENTTRLIKAAGGTLDAIARQPIKADIEVVRRTPEGSRRFRAADATILQPGDLLDVKPLVVTGAFR
jgi:protein involved in polysaccharide export with SLBB domain